MNDAALLELRMHVTKLLIDVFEQVLPRNEFCKRFSPSSAEAARYKHVLSGTHFPGYLHLDTFPS